ncbi:MAG: lysophospholipid acyltransferase family protein [Chthoniobacteraceae bacterium]
MKAQAKAPTAAVSPRVSAWAMRLFAKYNQRYLRGRFHSLRILQSGLPPLGTHRPVVIYLNHSSWWDPLVCLALAQTFFQSRTSFAPIDAAMLARYGFFRHLGFYPVEQQSMRGTRQFLRTTQAILASSHHAVWLTPQGRFVDVRERPLRLQSGLGALAVQNPEAAFVPLAIEYAFWTEPRPEILVSFGTPVTPRLESAREVAGWTETFTTALEETQDELATRSCRRDPAEWRMLDQGASGIATLYDAWRRLRAAVRGERFVAEHREEVRR